MSVSILGCGWLGLALAERLVAAGHQVKGSTTSPEKIRLLEERGIEPYIVRLTPELEGDRLSDFFEADILFLNIPPGRRRADVESRHPEEVAAVREMVERSPVHWVILASSTSVYPDLGRIVTEEDAGPPVGPSGTALLAAERILLDATSFDTTVIRFAGLYGYDRRPGRFLAARRDVENGEAPVNLIHRDDAVAVVEAILAADLRGEVLNACSDSHPTRRSFYTRAARRLELEPPTFAAETRPNFKIVSSERLKERLGYRFIYPDPLQDAP